MAQDFHLSSKATALEHAEETCGLLIQTARLLATKHMNHPGLSAYRNVLGRWKAEDVSMHPRSLVGFFYRQSRGEDPACPKGPAVRCNAHLTNGVYC